MNTPEPGERKVGRLGRSPRRLHSRASALGVGALALVLAATGIVAAQPDRAEPAQAAQGSTSEAGPTARKVVILDTRSKDKQEEDKQAKQEKPTPKPTQDPAVAQPSFVVLEDGVYPAYIRGVDVGEATVTLDVVQLFKHRAAVKAAVQDGENRRDAKYLSLWVRNENGLLRTLPASEDLRIRFLGGCESGDQRVLLKKLSRETTPFNTTYYYSVTVANDTIERIVQHLAIVAC